MRCECEFCVGAGRQFGPGAHRLFRTQPKAWEAWKRDVVAKPKATMPPMTALAKNATKAIVRLGAAVMKGEPITVSPATLEARKAACAGCEKNQAGWCGVCGCALAAKQRLASETCPLGRWPTPSPP